MLDSTRVFKPSARRLRTYVLTMGVFLTVLCLVVVALTAQVWDSLTIGYTAACIAMLWLLSIPVAWGLLHLSWRGLRLEVGPAGIVRRQGAVRQVVGWGEITRVRVAEGSTGPAYVEVFTAEGKALFLDEFEQLGEVARLIQAGIGPGVHVERA